MLHNFTKQSSIKRKKNMGVMKKYEGNCKLPKSGYFEEKHKRKEISHQAV